MNLYDQAMGNSTRFGDETPQAKTTGQYWALGLVAALAAVGIIWAIKPAPREAFDKRKHSSGAY